MARSPVKTATHDNSIAVIAGGSAGIGRAVAERLVREGYDVVVLARGKERVQRAAQELSQLVEREVTTLGLVCDVSKASAVNKARDKVLQRFGRLDVWVNAAMLTVFSPFDQLDDNEFRAVMDTTFMGQVNGTRAALQSMKRTGRGRIVNIGSGLSYRSVPLQSAYCAAKHAINGFTSAVRSELIHDGYEDIKISLVQLPGVNTPQFDWARHKLSHTPRPAAPVFNPEVAAEGVWEAIRTGAREMIVGRSAAQLMFGQMVVPNYLDHKMADVAWSGQHSEEPASGPREGNLMSPVAGEYSSHGSWDDEAEDGGLVVNADHARYALFGGAAVLGIGLGMLAGGLLGRRSSGSENGDELLDERHMRLAGRRD